jgi:hypothetical protein
MSWGVTMMLKLMQHVTVWNNELLELYRKGTSGQVSMK